jgi:multiple antibiotic resistance protein
MVRQFLFPFISIFVALDIVGTLPLYLGMTSGLNAKARNRTVDLSMQVALVVAIVFLFLGDPLFNFIGVTLYDFKIAGGLVLLLISLADLLGNYEAGSRASGSTGIVPLAVPLITGPGVLTTLVLQAGTAGIWMTLLALLTNYFLAWLLLRRAERITRVIGLDGTAVVSKVAALLLAAIAVAMIRAGVFEAIRGNH